MEPWWELTPASKAVPRERLAEAAQVSRTVQQYLAELEQQNPLADPEQTQTASKPVSTIDPDAAWTAAKSGPVLLAYTTTTPSTPTAGCSSGGGHASTLPARDGGPYEAEIDVAIDQPQQCPGEERIAFG